MPKDASYHKAAIRYNEELAVFAENLAKKLENDEIKRWCRSVSRQHKIHAGHHKKALKRLKNSFRPRKNQEKHVNTGIDPMDADTNGLGENPAEEPATPDNPTETPAPVDPAPTAPPVENDPTPEPDPEPVSAGVGTSNVSGGVTA